MKMFFNSIQFWFCLLVFIRFFTKSYGAEDGTFKIKIGFLVPMNADEDEVKSIERLVQDFNGQHFINHRRKRWNSNTQVDPTDDEQVQLQLPDAKNSVQIFEAIIGYVSFNDTFMTHKTVCQLVENGIVAAYGNRLGHLGDQIASILNFFGIPFIQANPSILWNSQKSTYGTSMNIYPSRRSISKMIKEVVVHHKMSPLTIVYEEEEELLLWKDFFEMGFQNEILPPIFVRICPDDDETTKIQLLNGLKTNNRMSNLVLLSHSQKWSSMILELTIKLGILNSDTQIFVSAFGFSSMKSLEPYMYTGANFTVTSLSGVKDEEFKHNKKGHDNIYELFLLDGLAILSKKFYRLKMEDFPMGLSCQANRFWQKGMRLVRSYYKMKHLGLSGLINLDEHGERSDLTLDILQLKPTTVNVKSGNLQLAAVWSTAEGLLSKDAGVMDLENAAETQDNNTPAVLKRPLVVSTVLSPPYTMLRQTEGPDVPSDPNSKYEGFVVDLIHSVSEIIGFNYSIAITNAYGSMDPKTGRWDGMIKELLEERADMAIADLSISYQREQVVDFTMPFLDLGISILYVRSPKKSVDLFAFLSPLSTTVWILVLVSAVSVSMVIFLIAKFSPYETAELDGPSDHQSPFSFFRHCLWFSVASWVQQGCDFLPRAMSGRTVASFWWFFTLILISSYTANLAAFLTIERMEVPIESAADLAAQNKIRYGALRSGSTASFFRDSKDETYSKMWRTMSRMADEVMVNSNQEGLDKVMAEDGAFAFFMESTSIEYQTERNCRLLQIGGLLDAKSYGIALPQGSPLRSMVSSAIIKLNEEGVIQRLKTKWWKKERGGGACQKDETPSSVSELNLENVGGIFLVLLLGLILSTFMAAGEYFWHKCKKPSSK